MSYDPDFRRLWIGEFGPRKLIRHDPATMEPHYMDANCKPCIESLASAIVEEERILRPADPPYMYFNEQEKEMADGRAKWILNRMHR